MYKVGHRSATRADRTEPTLFPPAPTGDASIENSRGRSIGRSGAMTAIGSSFAVARIRRRGNRISGRHIIRARGYLGTVEAESYPAFCSIHWAWSRCLFPDLYVTLRTGTGQVEGF